MTQEDKDKIIKIAKDCYDKIDILRVEDIGIEKKAQAIYAELPGIYRKLEEIKVLPDKVNFQVFMELVTTRLQIAAQEAQMFRNFNGFA